MFLHQTNVTPKDERIAESSGKHLKLNKDIYMVLKPIELPTQISMQTFVNTTTECFLHIRNTNDHSLNVNITKRPLEERFVELSFITASIEGNSNATLKITWSPRETGLKREVLQLRDSCERLYDILLIMEAKVPQSHVRNLLISYPSRNVDCHSKSSFYKKLGQSRNKRTRKDFDIVIPSKENVTNIVEHDPFTEKAIKKPRKEILSKIYTTTPKCRPNLIKIGKNKGVNDVDDFLSPPKPKARSKFSLAIGNTNFAPRISASPDEVFEFSPRGCSTWTNFKFKKPICNDGADLLSSTPSRKETFLKPSRLVQNFDILSPISFPQCETDFASSPLLSVDCSNLQTLKKVGNTSSRNVESITAKKVRQPRCVRPDKLFSAKQGSIERAPKREEKDSSDDKKTFTFHEAKRRLEMPKPNQLQKVSASKSCQPAEKIKKMTPTKNRKVSKSQEPVLKSKQFSKAPKKKNPSVPGGRIANRSLAAINRKKSLPLKTEKKTSVELHEPSDFMIKVVNPDPFAATTTEDPFLACTLSCDEKWVFFQELEFKKWLNKLMTAPEHLTSDIDSTSVDVGKVWQSCRMKEEVVLAESKESISARYHTNTRLNTLRKAACMMFRKDEVKEALSGATHCIENGSLVFKKDKDPYRDIGLQKEILELFLSYNPLWLRIGLETVYGETIPLQSNNDLVGLSRFLLGRFFSDPFLLKKHSHPTIVGMKLPAFTLHMNNFVLKKFLQVVYFLDYAKMNKLIGYDPCLFRKTSQHKESRSILLTFSREVLSGIGDITKVLRLARYVVNYKQTYLDEFDYAVNDISLDLRDGVRLCRTMELIRGKGNLTSYCRVPAISKLQKIHNVNIALTALLDSGYFLTGQIDAKSIVNGDREKTLSLLWQIIYKFQAPKFEKAATCLQTWWRSKLWYVRVKNFLKKRRSDAACVIQKAWRCYSVKKKQSLLRVDNEGVRERNRYLETKSAVQKIQRWWRRDRETKPFIKNLREKYEAVILIQRVWRAKKLMHEKKLEYLKLNASLVIQKWWRGILILKRDRNIFLLMKHAVWVFEKSWFERKMIKKERREYFRKRNSAIAIQRFWRRYISTKNQVSQLRTWRKSSLKIQSWWRSVVVRRDFQIRRNSCLKIQNWWRSLQETKSCQASYFRTKKAALVIQKNWRMVKAMENYSQIKFAVLRIESWYEGLLLSRSVHEEFLRKKSCVKKIESWWKNYLERKSAAVIRIQYWWREVLKNKQLEVEKELEYRIENLVKTQNVWKGSENATREEETLANKLQKSIYTFLFCNDLGRLSMCLASLDLITRLSASSCITVCKVGLVDKIFMTLVQSNRSLPWFEVCMRASSILITLAKYPPTRTFVLKENYIETLARLLTVTVEKEVQLFLHLATLMWILIEDPKYAKVVLGNSRSAWLLKSLYGTVNRKKYKFALANPEAKDQVLPNSKPDWGLKQKQPRIFGNVVHAVASLSKRLGEY